LHASNLRADRKNFVWCAFSSSSCSSTKAWMQGTLAEDDDDDDDEPGDNNSMAGSAVSTARPGSSSGARRSGRASQQGL
jgi:hypothetical protein